MREREEMWVVQCSVCEFVYEIRTVRGYEVRFENGAVSAKLKGWWTSWMTAWVV